MEERLLYSERERMNLPMGMSELDLLTYNKTLYELYRTEGSGMDNDAFRYDPIVSAGMLASDFAVADGLWWVNLLTPESQSQIDPGDDLVVPVRTYDNYEQLPPWEQRMSQDLSYTGGRNKNNKMNANNFVGNFNNYFDNESRLLGAIASKTALEPVASEVIGTGTAETAPAPVYVPPAPLIVGTGTTAPVVAPAPVYVPTTPLIVGTGSTATPRPIASLAAPAPVYVPPAPLIVGTGTAAPKTDTPVVIIVGPSDGNTGIVAAGGPADTGAGAGEEVIDGGGFGGGGGGGGGGGAEMPTEEGSKEGGGQAPIICKTSYKPVFIGAVLGLIVGYLYAKNKNKDVKTFGVIVAIIGAILGYVYAKHQCSPIALLTKLKVPSKVNKILAERAAKPAESTSKYYGGR
jgi:hypothetical protein